MNLFVLPAWYPSAAQPAAGIFVREQVAALAALRPDWRIAVGHWGGHDGALSLREPGMSLRALAWRLRARPSWRPVDGFFEAQAPRLSWTLALARGGAAGALSASRQNLAEARSRLGQIDLIHAHVGFPAGWIASILAAETGLPYVLTEHMSPFPVAMLLEGGQACAELRAAYGGAAAVLAVGPALAERIRALGLRCDQVVPNLVDDTRFVPPPESTPASGRPWVLLALGGLTRRKGFDLLLRALARWNPPHGRVELRIGGDGPCRRDLHRLTDELGLADRVRWLGAVPPSEVPARMAECDAFVLPSREETFGIVVAEALCCGRPVVATRCGGPEAIVHEGNGLLVPPEDPGALAQALARLYERREDWDVQAIRADAVRRFGRVAVATRLAAVYEGVLTR